MGACWLHPCTYRIHGCTSPLRTCSQPPSRTIRSSQMDRVLLVRGAGEGTDQMAADPAGGRPEERQLAPGPRGGARAPARGAPGGAALPVADGPPGCSPRRRTSRRASGAWAIPSEKAQLATRVRRRARAMASREGSTPMAVPADVTASGHHAGEVAGAASDVENPVARRAG